MSVIRYIHFSVFIDTQILSEILDLPKTFGSVYGVGGGSRLDAEILIYMKSQGWPERVQVFYLYMFILFIMSLNFKTYSHYNCCARSEC